MIWQDALNSAFLFSAGSLTWLNVRRAWMDRKISGVSYWPTVLFTSWGVWDCYYFPHLNQWLSMVGSVMAVLPNAAWLYLYWRFRNGRTV